VKTSMNAVKARCTYTHIICSTGISFLVCK
jgi:hypothetical protein